MRQLTFPGFTKQYVASLSRAGTTAIYPLTREAVAQNHRLREPLLLYALANGQEKVLMTAVRNTPLAEYYGGLLRNYGPTDAVNMHWNECAALFSTGGAAMVTDADSIWASFCGPDTQVYDKTGFAVSPNNATWNICAWGLGISANSPHMEAAKAFMKWAAGVEMTKYIQTSGISSARTSAWEDPACTANYPAELLAAIQEGNKIATKAYDRPMTTSVAAARDVIGVVITTSIEGGDVQAAADKANEEFQKILDEDAAAK